jgi:drug/metabolite transporter (DMT)-like permease
MQKSTDNTFLAVVLTLASLVLFDLMGLIIKSLSDHYSAAELSAYRNIFGLVPSGLALWMNTQWRTGPRRLALRQWRLAAVRGVAVAIAQLTFYISLGLMAFATASTMAYSMSLFTVAFAVPLLGERVGLIRWSAVAVGFLGVIMIMRPASEAFSWELLLPVLAAVCYAYSGVTARLIDDDVPTALFNLYSSVVAAIVAAALAFLLTGYSSITSLYDLTMIVLMGLFGGSAVLLLVISYRLTEPSNLAPFNYFGIPIAFALGWIFFDEAPFADLWPGAILIMGGGLLIVFRERHLIRGR